MLLTEHLQRNPTYEKREGEALTSPGHPLTNLTTVKLSRKKMSENLRPNVCGTYALQGSSRALYTPLDPTHEQCTWPVPSHEVGCAVLILVVWCGGGGLVWQWSGVGVGAWSDLWSDLRLVWLSDVVVWSGADHLMGCWCGLVPWPNLDVWPRKMVWSDGWKLERW